LRNGFAGGRKVRGAPDVQFFSDQGHKFLL
jgi:hypothetical protein